jgi:hypothetical protein
MQTFLSLSWFPSVIPSGVRKSSDAEALTSQLRRCVLPWHEIPLILGIVAIKASLLVQVQALPCQSTWDPSDGGVNVGTVT